MGTMKAFAGKQPGLEDKTGVVRDQLYESTSQAIATPVFFHHRDPEGLPLALKIAKWTITQMQDPTGYFYYRRYSSWLVKRTPTLHWGQAAMLCALAGLYKLL